MATNKIVDVYRQIINKYSSKGEYGGKGKFHLPVDHKAALVLKEGAFSCEHCQYVNAEKHECGNKNYIEWNGGDPKLPDAPLNKICSDWFEPK